MLPPEPPPPSPGPAPGPPVEPPPMAPGVDADELHRRAVAVREARQGRGPAVAWEAEAGGPSQGRWRSAGYRSSSRRGTAVVGLVAATVIADLAGVALDVQGLGLMDAAASGELGQEEAAAFDNTYGLVGMIQLAAYIASAVAVLAWLSRVVENVPPLTGQVPRRSPREAIVWWFVPVANYVVPYQIVGDTVRRLCADGGGLARSLLPIWWIAWVAANLVGNVLWRLPSETIDQLRQLYVLTAISDAASVVAGILLILIVRAIEQGSEARAASLGLGGANVPEGPPRPGTRPQPIPPEQAVEKLLADAGGPMEPPSPERPSAG